MWLPDGKVRSFDAGETPERFYGVSVVFDLEGFTEFCLQPQIDERLPELLNLTLRLLASHLYPEESAPACDSFLRFRFGDSLPVHFKFLGDGGLLVWQLPHDHEERLQAFLQLLQRLFLVKRKFGDEIGAFYETVALPGLPKAIRFGVATGEICRLRVAGSRKPEYVGFPINLSSRLQCYCRPLGFLASARIGMATEHCEKNGYRKVNAKKLKGFQKEMLIVDDADFSSLSPRVQKELFEKI